MTGAKPAAEIRAHAAALPLNPFQSLWLDMLRGVAAQFVVLAHAIEMVFPHRSLGSAEIGQFGVSVFFLLSGFLITQAILDRAAAGRFTLTEFMVSRFARIYAPLVPALLLVALLDAAMLDWPHYAWRQDYGLGTALANLAMLQDFPLFQVLRRLGVAEQPWFFGPFGSGRPLWTISIEWWIYVSVGIAAALALRRRVARWLLVVLAFALVEPAYHAIGNQLTLFWILGGLLAVARHSQGAARFLPATPRGRGVMWVVAVGCLGLALARMAFKQWLVFDLAFMSLAAVALFAPVFGAERGSGRAGLVLRGLGATAWHSYSLYLIHFTLLALLLPALGGVVSGWPLAAALVVAANLAALPFAWAFEMRHRRLRAWLLARLGGGTGMRRGTG